LEYSITKLLRRVNPKKRILFGQSAPICFGERNQSIILKKTAGMTHNGYYGFEQIHRSAVVFNHEYVVARESIDPPPIFHHVSKNIPTATFLTRKQQQHIHDRHRRRQQATRKKPLGTVVHERMAT
jgi:hypothetical protein